VRRFYTVDPFGNRIELIQAGDSFAQHMNEEPWQTQPNDPATTAM
jgi:hypothetical protein